MVASIGAERFEQFWTSDLAPTAAFEQATGIPLAQWTRDWLEDTYGPHQTGPALPAGASGFGALILIGGAVLAAIAAKRRTAG